LNPNEFLTPDAVVIYPSRARIFLVFLGSLAFVALGFFLWKNWQETEGPRALVAAVAGIGFFGLGAVFALVKLISRQPALVINSSGFMFGKYSLHWDEVESIYISSMRVSAFSTQRFISVRLKRPEEFLSRQPALMARLMKANMGLTGAHVNISANVLPMKPEDLVATMRNKCPALQVLGTQ
jgi:hypothetical protein